MSFSLEGEVVSPVEFTTGQLKSLNSDVRVNELGDKENVDRKWGHEAATARLINYIQILGRVREMQGRANPNIQFPSITY